MSDLTPQDWEAVRAYAYHDMGLTAAARELHMHVNTLRYHLGKVYEVTGLNPKSFKGLNELLWMDAVRKFKEDSNDDT